ncbi:hypothetical protein BU15DRAFT_76594 [Melanogaster broomeanus]|nr:hypothetical protein BU15DRAFT_76594 [Melanogaster broomeanus]
MAHEYPNARRRPPKANRNSNIVRASVLETALELGITQNSTVANWIFSNPLAEEPEEEQSGVDNADNNPEPATELEEMITPTLTSTSNTTSDESSSLNSPQNLSAGTPVSHFQVHTHKPSVTEPPHVHFGDFSSEQLQLFSSFNLSPPAPTSVLKGQSNNLLGKPSRDTERACSQDDSLRHNPSHDNPSPGLPDIGYLSEGQYLSKGGLGKGKDKSEKKKPKRGSKPKALDLSKSDDRDTDYASDGGYLSASSNKSQGKSPSKSKSRAMSFFRRRPKKSQRGSDEEDEDEIPPVPAIPSFPTPSSPKPLERRATPSSPTRSGFTPLTLNFSGPPGSPLPKRRASKSPSPVRVNTSHSHSPPRPSDRSSVTQPTASPVITSASAPGTLIPTLPLAPSALEPPLSMSCPPTPLPHPASVTSSRPASGPPSRYHLGIPPPAPPPTLPLPQPPPSPSMLSRMLSPSPPARPTTPSRRDPPSRAVPSVPNPAEPALPLGELVQPLSPRRGPSPFRTRLSSKVPPPGKPDLALLQPPHGEGYRGSAVLQQSSDPRAEGDQAKGPLAFVGRHHTDVPGSASCVVTPAFLQRRMQPGVSTSPRHPPPDAPLPRLPSAPGPSARTPIGSPTKFHEHFSSVTSISMSRILSAPPTASPTPSTVTLSGSSSGPSVRSSHTSLSTSDRGDAPPMRDSLGIPDYSHPATSASEVGSSFSRSPMRLASRFSDRSEISLSIYPPTTHRDSASVSAYDDDDADVDEVGTNKSAIDEADDDASVYPSDDKTAGRRTMYLMEHGESEENENEIVITGSQYWSEGRVHPPLPTRPGPGFF